MPKNLSVQEIKAVAEAAITARFVADAAKTQWENVAGSDQEATLKTAYDQAEQAALDAKTKADALSQTPSHTPLSQVQIDKKKRKIKILQSELKGAGQDDDNDDDEDEDDIEDLDRPLTQRDLQRIEREKATETSLSMAEAITDPVAQQAVKDALARVVASGDPAKDFADAVAIANRDKNNKVLEEMARRRTPVQHASGAGAPLNRPEAEFTPTAIEASYMKHPFNLSKEDILRARGPQQ